ncbi:MAG: DUF523 and DUF1722 domain-containing protein [Gemmatimonadetes bacterium]|nr:DUF523 and DUF1722 domain-containing protein [Gemmatimonadota bacterium]MYD26622.1 DUF523 and DUF1722 domain-containing protein [Gemmatimonadota bacterium]MYI99848.1 DUF523 and DUF1722 domain-containing protein [Gemmatimonadota bacterium]
MSEMSELNEMSELSMMDIHRAEMPVRIGISSCLLGERVRYDGGHKRDDYLVDVVGRYVEWIPVCPEVEAGMGTPRETVQLTRVDGDVRMLTKNGVDHTDMVDWFARQRVQTLEQARLSGYILKSRSPSCGMGRVPVVQPEGAALRNGRGIFARRLMDALPHLPVEEERRLHNPRVRENFISRVFACYRWLQLADSGLTRQSLMSYHRAYKYLLMAHSQEGTRRLGRLLAKPERYATTGELSDAYLGEFNRVMKRTPSRRNHTNVLQHMAGYVSDRLDARTRRELTRMIQKYHEELLPLIVPVVMLRHYVREFDITYLQDQTYLQPFPGELMLLNQL